MGGSVGGGGGGGGGGAVGKTVTLIIHERNDEDSDHGRRHSPRKLVAGDAGDAPPLVTALKRRDKDVVTVAIITKEDSHEEEDEVKQKEGGHGGGGKDDVEDGNGNTKCVGTQQQQQQPGIFTGILPASQENQLLYIDQTDDDSDSSNPLDPPDAIQRHLPDAIDPRPTDAIGHDRSDAILVLAKEGPMSEYDHQTPSPNGGDQSGGTLQNESEGSRDKKCLIWGENRPCARDDDKDDDDGHEDDDDEDGDQEGGDHKDFESNKGNVNNHVDDDVHNNNDDDDDIIDGDDYSETGFGTNTGTWNRSFERQGTKDIGSRTGEQWNRSFEERRERQPVPIGNKQRSCQDWDRSNRERPRSSDAFLEEQRIDPLVEKQRWKNFDIPLLSLKKKMEF